MKFQIEPYKKVGPISFGMNEGEIKSFMGEPERITRDRIGNDIYWYNNCNIIFERSKVVEVGFGPNSNVSVFGINPLCDFNEFKKICVMDGNPHEIVGVIVLHKIGLTFGGFHNDDDSQKAMTAFVYGRWDVPGSEMVPYNIPV